MDNLREEHDKVGADWKSWLSAQDERSAVMMPCSMA